MRHVKKAVISIVMAMALALITNNPKAVGQNWLAFFLVAWIMEGLCIVDNKPIYKKVFIHAIWIALVKAGLSLFIEIKMVKVLNEYSFDLNNFSEILIVFFIYSAIFYISAVITGLLTVTWLSKRKSKNDNKENVNPIKTIF